MCHLLRRTLATGHFSQSEADNAQMSQDFPFSSPPVSKYSQTENTKEAESFNFISPELSSNG